MNRGKLNHPLPQAPAAKERAPEVLGWGWLGKGKLEMEAQLTNNEKEMLAREVAGDNYGLSLEDPGGYRESEQGRLRPDERRAFDAGWKAAKSYYETHQ